MGQFLLQGCNREVGGMANHALRVNREWQPSGPVHTASAMRFFDLSRATSSARTPTMTCGGSTKVGYLLIVGMRQRDGKVVHDAGGQLAEVKVVRCQR